MCSLESSFLRFFGSSTVAMLPIFLWSANALSLYFASVKAGSEITENGLLSGSASEGNDQLRLSNGIH